MPSYHELKSTLLNKDHGANKDKQAVEQAIQKRNVVSKML